MSKFITGKELEDAVYNIIWEAKNELLIVSPYINLGDYFKELFEKQLMNPKLHITIIFGKNEGQVNKSFNKKDLEFFKQFPNISIVYAPKLHAKYYANDNKGVVTSINLYDYSFVNNVEFGVLYENNFLNKLAKHTDNIVWETCIHLADDNELIYVKRPVFKFNAFSKDEFKETKVLLDRTNELYSGRTLARNYKKIIDFEDLLDYNNYYEVRPERTQERPKREEAPKREGIKPQFAEKKNTWDPPIHPGYCIRTGEKITFNPERPLSNKAYQSWSFYSNPDFPEKFCHFSGEPSNGETSFGKPILRKNWKLSQAVLNF